MVSSRMTLLMIMTVVMVGVVTRVVEAQSTPPSCASKLVGCAPFINSTTRPPSSCCDPLREAVERELDCLCNLYQNPSIFQQLGINITEALLLPGKCHVSGDISACSRASGPGSSSTPPATPGSSGGSSGVGKIASTGLSSLLLLWASLMLC